MRWQSPSWLRCSLIANEQLDRQRRLIRRQTDQLQVGMIAGRKHPARFAFPARLERRLVASVHNSECASSIANRRLPTPGGPTNKYVLASRPAAKRPAKLLHHIVVPKNAVPHAKPRAQVSICVGPIIAEKFRQRSDQSSSRFFSDTPESVILTYVDQYTPADSSKPQASRSVDGIDGLYSIGNRRRRLPRVRIALRRSAIDDRQARSLRRLLDGVHHPAPTDQPALPQKRHQQRKPSRQPTCPSTSASTAAFAARGCSPAPKTSARSSNAPIAAPLTVIPPPPPPKPKNMPAALEGEQYELWDADEQPLPSQLIAAQPKYSHAQVPPMRHRDASRGQTSSANPFDAPIAERRTSFRRRPRPVVRPSVLTPDALTPDLDPDAHPGERPSFRAPSATMLHEERARGRVSPRHWKNRSAPASQWRSITAAGRSCRAGR